jgi:hypothetical protein
MTEPELSITELNSLLVPANLADLTTAQQNNILGSNEALRGAYIKFFYDLQYKANKYKPCGPPVTALYMFKSDGDIIGLSGCQQIGLYFYFISNKSTGLSRLIAQSFKIQEQLQLQRLRSVNNPT